MILIPLITISHSFLLKRIIDTITGDVFASNITTAIIILASIMAGLTILRGIIDKLVDYSSGIQRELLEKTMTEGIMDKVLKSDIEVFDNPEYYDKMTSASRDSYAVSSILWSALDSVSALVACVGSFVALAGSNFVYGLLIIATCIPSAIASRGFTKAVYQISLDQVPDHRKAIYIHQLVTSKEHAQNIKLYGIGRLLKNRYLSIWQSMFDKRKGVVKKRAAITGLLNILPDIALAFIIINIALGAAAGTSTVGDFTLYTGLITTLIGSVNLFVASYLLVYDNRQKIDTVKTFTDSSFNNIPDGNEELGEIKSIEFKDVSFTYPRTKRKVLNGISFSVEHKEKVAFVGVNGAGKTTLIKLLLRYYDPDEGEVYINGKNTKEYSLESLRKQFSTYFQNTANFGFSIKENVTLGDINREPSDYSIKEALKLSGAQRLTEKALKGIDTTVYRIFDDEGIELSGGENQSLALSRAFYRNCSAYILDEPSSSLDPEAEAKLFDNIEMMSKDKTVIFTSQRLSNVYLADKIIVIENGTVLETGSQKELLSIQSRYAELFNLQADKFKLEEE